jgi:CheY-like chemotaxis protein
MVMILRHDESSPGATVIDYSVAELSPQVLVVDDTKQIRDLLRAILCTCGYRVLEAEDGLAAQNILMAVHPALVISDLEMPVVSGWDLLTYCHAHCPDLPVMLISGGLLGKRPEIECWAAGVVAKPFDLERLRAEIQRLVARAA